MHHLFRRAGGFPPAPPGTMETLHNETLHSSSLPARVGKFILILGIALAFIYGFLPMLTSSVPVLGRMAQYLDSNGIDPTRYYYTDVEQVKEAELYLRSVLRDDEQ